MRNWLKWLFAGKEMALLETYRTTLDENRRFFSVTTDISLVLENINIQVEGEEWRKGDIIPCSVFELRNRILRMRDNESIENTKVIQASLIQQLKGITKPEEEPEKQIPLFGVFDQPETSLPSFTNEGPVTITFPLDQDKEYFIVLQNGKTCNVKNLVDASSITHEEVVKYFENGITDSAVATVLTFLKKYTLNKQQNKVE